MTIESLPLTVIVATGNQGKMREVREILSDTGWKILSMAEAGLSDEPEETGTTFEENALIKARSKAIMAGKGVMIIADDSGLEIDALDKEPGIYSARYLGEDTTFPEKCAHLLERLVTTPTSERTARFVCAVAIVLPDGSEKCFRGVVEGRISEEMRGDLGFGYDPIFLLPERGLTMAQIPEEEKNMLSHRGEALRLMKEELMNSRRRAIDENFGSKRHPS
jgi:non-canonical purine NTP pyrophosphatase (RdgB/HAM1 family)